MTNSSLNQGQMLNNSSPNAIDIKQLTTILSYRRYLILGISCAVISIASVLAILAKPNYQSSMQILVSSKLDPGLDANKQGKTDSQGTEDVNVQVVDYTTQQKLMESSPLIKKAVDLLRPNYPNITLEDIKGKPGQYEKSSLNVTQIKTATGINDLNNQIFEISFKDKDPVKTQKVLQALQTVYHNYNIEEQKERLNQGLAYVNARLPEVRKQVSQSEQKLEKFRKKYNLVDPEVQSKILLQSLADVQKQLQNTRAQIQDIKARQAGLEQKMVSLSQKSIVSSRLSQSPRYQTLLNEVQKTELELSQQRLRYTENSPVIETLKQQRQSQLALLRQEVGRSAEANDTNTNNSNPGQIAGVDLKLVEELNQIQTTSLGLIANEKSLVGAEQKLRVELSKYPSIIAEYNRLLPDIRNSRQTLEQLLQQQQSLGMTIAQTGFDWQLLEAPEKGTYIGSGRLFLLGGALITGPILGIITALIWQIFHDVIYSPQQLRKLTNLRLLGAVPNITNNGRKRRIFTPFKHQESMASLGETIPSLPDHEYFDLVYQNIQLFNYPVAFKSLMLTSTLAGEGKTTLALGLAASASHMHRRVLVIDANLQHPSLHKKLNLSNDWGLSLLLVDESNNPVAEYIQPIHPHIDVLTAGPAPEDAIKLLSSGRMKEIIELFEQTYDLVLIDAPAILNKVDARIMASLCNAIVLVGRIGQVTQSELMDAREIFSNLNLIGAIANDVKQTK